MEQEKDLELMEKAAEHMDDCEPESERHWYVIHTATGYENKVKNDLERKVRSMGLEAQIFNVIVPLEKEIVIRNGKEHTVERKLFPGYVLVEMFMNGFSWYVVRNTPGVTRFVGPDGTKPSPLTPSEVKSILKATRAEAKVTFDIQVTEGEGVRVVKGSYENYTGTVVAIDRTNGRITIVTQIMDGRDVRVELDVDEIEAL